MRARVVRPGVKPSIIVPSCDEQGPTPRAKGRAMALNGNRRTSFFGGLLKRWEGAVIVSLQCRYFFRIFAYLFAHSLRQWTFKDKFFADVNQGAQNYVN